MLNSEAMACMPMCSLSVMAVSAVVDDAVASLSTLPSIVVVESQSQSSDDRIRFDTDQPSSLCCPSIGQRRHLTFKEYVEYNT